MKDYFENEYETIWSKNGIIHIVFKPDLFINLEIAKIFVQARLKVTKEKIRPVFADIRGMKRIDDDARDYWATEEACRFISGTAIFSGNRIQTLFANFYINFSKPQVPTRLFTNKEKALKWLDQHKIPQDNKPS
jgi:hypothetical protein